MAESQCEAGAGTLLLVEDDAGHAMLIRHALESVDSSIRIEHVTDGEAALNYLFHRGDDAHPHSRPLPRAVLLDLRLPKVDGLEVLRAIKAAENLQSVPVIVLTTSSAEPDVATAYAHRANSYLVKPLSFDEFSRMLRDVHCYWLRWNAEPPPEPGEGTNAAAKR